MKAIMNMKFGAVVAMLVALTGCGGGSESTATSAQSPATPSNPQTNMPAPTYAAASSQLAVYNEIKAFRTALGLGELRQDAALDQAATAHVNYILQNQDINFGALDVTGNPVIHGEESTRPGFTGATPSLRAQAAGYGSQQATEVISAGTSAVELLVASVYHRQALMLQNYTDFGVGVGSNLGKTTVIMFGAKTTQAVPATYLGTYPGNGQTGVRRNHAEEVPNPYPDVTGYVSQQMANPVSVSGPIGTQLIVNSFTITEAGQAATISARVLSNANDSRVERHNAFLVANGILKANTTYTVSFTGSVNGTTISKVWSFTTGS